MPQAHDNKSEGGSIIQEGVKLGPRESNHEPKKITQTLICFRGPVSNTLVKGRQSAGDKHRAIEWHGSISPSMTPSTEMETGLLNDQAADEADAKSEREVDGQAEVEA
jgi:hypothetical protein